MRKTRDVGRRLRNMGIMEFEHTPSDWKDMRCVVLSPTRIVVGYLVHDEHCEDPLDDRDASGKIIPFKTACDELGMTRDGDPILDQFIQFLARLAGEETDGPSWSEERCATARALWEQAYEAGKVGSLYARALRERYHSGYDELDDPLKRTPDAVWVPDPALMDYINTLPEDERAKAARDAFEAALEEFNTWAEGDCYGKVIEEFVREPGTRDWTRDGEDDSCWGYVGGDYAEEELESELAWYRKNFIAKRGKKEHDHGRKSDAVGNPHRLPVAQARGEARA